MKKAGGRTALAALLNVEVITTYHWKHVLPEKHDRFLRALKPEWYVLEQVEPQPELAMPGGA